MDSVLLDMMSDPDSTSLEADDYENPLEVISRDDDETLDDL